MQLVAKEYMETFPWQQNKVQKESINKQIVLNGPERTLQLQRFADHLYESNKTKLDGRMNKNYNKHSYKRLKMYYFGIFY